MIKRVLNALRVTKKPGALDKGALAEAILALQQPKKNDRGFSPQILAKALKAADGGDFAELMGLAALLEDRDAQWRTVLQSRKLAVTRLPIRVEAAMDDQRHQRDANLVRDILAQSGARRLLFDLLDGLSKGFAVVEVEWSMTGQRWMPQRYVWRDPRLFCTTPEDPDQLFWTPKAAEALGIDPKTPMSIGESLPPLGGRFIIHRPMLASAPAPQAGLCRLGIWLWMFKNFVTRDWVEFIEGFGQPLRVGTYPPQSDEAAIATLRRAVLELGRAAGVIIPQGMDLRFEERAGQSNGALHLDAISYFDQLASKLVFGQTTTTDAISGGHAVSKTHDLVRSDIRDADAADLAESLERDLMKVVIDLNFGPPPDGLYPQIHIAAAEATDIDTLSSALEKLVPLGLRVEQSVVRDRIGLPDPPEGIDAALLLQPPRAEAALQTSLHNKVSSPLLARLSQQTSPAIDAMIDLVRRMIEEAEEKGLGLAEVQEQLLTLYEQLDIEQVAELIAKANMVSYLAGLAGEDKKKLNNLASVDPKALSLPPSGGGSPFDEAIRFFKDKVNIPTERYTDLWRGMHARGFMVAGAMKDELLVDFHQSLKKSVEQGTTLETFRKDFDSIVEKHGWGYKGGRDWRSKVIYQTNLDQSFMAGKWEQIERLKDRRPLLRYVHGSSVDPRPQHQAWHGLILPVDHPFWQTHYPKNGWGCTCTVMQLSHDDLKRYNWQVSDDPVTPLDPKTGCPVGIDKGFDYNVGIANVGRRLSDRDFAAWLKDQPPGQRASLWKSLTKGDWREHGFEEVLEPRPFQARSAEDIPKTVEEAGELLRKILGGDEVTLQLPGNLPVYVNVDFLVEHLENNIDRARIFPLLPELLSDPDEVWQKFEENKRTGQVVLRHRIIRAIKLDKDRYLLLSAQLKAGRFEAWTMIEYGSLTGINNQRSGRLLYKREE